MNDTGTNAGMRKSIDGIRPRAAVALAGVANGARRNFLRAAVFGGAGFVLGKVFGPSIPLFGEHAVVGAKDFRNFKVVETNKEFRVYGKGGDEIVIVEKD